MSALPENSTDADEQERHVLLVSKFVVAVREKMLHPSSPTFCIDWADAAEERLRHATLQDRYALIAFECLQHGVPNAVSKLGMALSVGTAPKVSMDKVLLFVQFLGNQLDRALKWNLLNLGLLLQLRCCGLHTMFYEIAPVMIQTSRAFVLPNLPYTHEKVCKLLAQRLSRGAASLKITEQLWLEVLSYLAAPPVVGGYWENVHHPLVLLVGTKSRVEGVQVFFPPKVNKHHFFPNSFLCTMQLQQMYKDYHTASRQDIQNMLANATRIEQSRLSRHITLDISMAVQALVIYLRLISGIPVLLVGNFSTCNDEAFANLVGDLLQLSSDPSSVNVEAGTSLEELTEGISAGTGKLSLQILRCDEHMLYHRVEFLQNVLVDWQSDQTLFFGSVHCNDVAESATKLLSRLPALLSEAIVFMV